MESKVTGPRRVLVCEDAEDARFLLAEMLRAYGFEVTETSRGSEAIAIVANGTIDIALIDIGLPDLNGLEVARQIHECEATQHVRLIAVTGYGTAQDRVASRNSGFHVHLLKPVTMEQLLAAIAATGSCDAPSG